MTTDVQEYLTQKNIPFRESGEELITHCLFNDCDKDSKGNEAHLYFNRQTSQYHCKKCGIDGNIITLSKHLGDNAKEVFLSVYNNGQNIEKQDNLFKETVTIDEEFIDSCHEHLPIHIREYLHNRGITDETINKNKLGFGHFYGKFWITIPVKDEQGVYNYIKLRQDPTDATNSIKYAFYPKGAKTTLFGWDSFKMGHNFIFICEGELDQMILTQKGIPAITSTSGVSTFNREWLNLIESFSKVYICFDTDEAGQKGADKLITLIQETYPEKLIYKINFPERMVEGKDVTDYFVKYAGTTEELLNTLPIQVQSLSSTKRFVQVETPSQVVDFTGWKSTIQSYFPDLLFPAEVSLSIIAQILIKDVTNPFALVLVDSPSAGKTIAINFFSEIKDLTYATDKFTPASFVSHASNVRKEKLKEIDLLPRLQYKMFLIRDLATLFSKRDDDLNECLGLLTRVLDGEGLNVDSGIHGQRQYIGEYLFMILAGSTPIPPRVWKMMGNLGSRLFFLNMNSKDKSEEQLVEQLTSLAYKEKEQYCRLATKDFLYSLWSKYPQGIIWDKTNENSQCLVVIARCAKLLARLRGVVNVWKDSSDDGTEYSYTSPVVEKPDRINQLFYNLCRGHALVTGRTQISEDDLKLIIELTFDSAPVIRAKLFRTLIEKGGKLLTHEVEKALQCSKPTALKEMETLRILGICEKVEVLESDSDDLTGYKIVLTDSLKWFLSDECKRLRHITS